MFASTLNVNNQKVVGIIFVNVSSGITRNMAFFSRLFMKRREASRKRALLLSYCLG